MNSLLTTRVLAIAVAVVVGMAAGPAGAGSITINNGNFELPYTGTWTVIPSWVSGSTAYYGDNRNGHLVYCDAPGWVSQDLGYYWTAGDVFTLGIRGNQGWRTGGQFKIQLREADGTVLWNSGTISVNSTWQNFSWNIDASTFSGAGVAPGSQLNIRIDCLAATVYLDDVTLSTSLADTTAPTLASSAIVDDKSGGPVNPGQKVTYTVTFSEAMDTNTVSSSDFDNGGTAAVLIGTPTTSGGVSYSIPVVATGPGTLQLRVPAGAILTDPAGNPLATGSAILDNTTISVVAKSIGVTGGGFEIPVLGTYAQPGDIPLWFNSTIGYGQWHNSSGYTSSGSQSALLQNIGSHGYMYQSLGQLEAGTTRLDWTFDQVRYTLDASAGTAGMRFFYGVALAAGEGVDIDTLGLTQIGSTVSIPALSGSDAFRSGSLDVSAVPAGSTIWVDFTHTGGSCFLLDNIAVVVADTTPPTLAGSAIVDDKTGGPVNAGDLVTYTVTFSEDMDSNTVSAADFGNAGTAAFTIGTVSETAPSSGVFTVPVTATGTGSLRLQVNAGAELKDVANNALNTTSAILDDTTIDVASSDTTPPTLAGSAIADNKSGGPVAVGALVTYTVTFSEDMDSGTVDATDFGNAGTAAFSIGTVTETSANSGVFTVPVTATGAGSLRLQVNAGADLRDTVGNPLSTTSAILDDTTITVDATAPTLAGSAIADNKSGGPVAVGALVTYTVTFSEDMDSGTVDATDFGNAGTAAFSIGTVTETSANSGVFTVPVTATGTGTLKLRVNAGAVLKDVVGNALATGSAILDDTQISVYLPMPITIGNFNFEAVPLPDWYWVPAWDEGGPSYVASDAASYGWSGAGRVLYLDQGGWVDQTLGYNWTATEVFTLGIKGNKGWNSSGAFKIQLREADGTVLWDSGTLPVTSTVSNFSWSIDASAFSGAGVAEGSPLNLRMECLAATVYLDDVTLGTSLTDTTAPTLGSSNIVDDKSGGPVNPGQRVTYTVTFSEAMDTNTVSSSDFDNGGTAAVLIGTPTTVGGVSFSIPVVATGAGTLRLRVPAGATMTDLAGNPLATGSAILDDTTINVVAKAIGVTGGDFEVPTVTTQVGDIPLWFDNTVAYTDLHQPTNSAVFGTSHGSQCALLQLSGTHGYIYQSLGQLQAVTQRLNWSFDHVRYNPALRATANGTADMRFFYGVALAAGEGTDIDTLGFTQIGSTVSIPAVTSSDAHLSGWVDVSSVPAGSTIWVDFTHTANGEFMLDNIVVIPTPFGTVYKLR